LICFLNFANHDLYPAFSPQKREKRRWIFRKPTNQETEPQQTSTKAAAASTNHESAAKAAAERKQALAVAVATAEAAMATAQAAVEVARLTRPTNHAKEHSAAVVIQTAFRGYLVSQRSTDLPCVFYKKKEYLAISPLCDSV
jgi:hypothetical protein